MTRLARVILLTGNRCYGVRLPVVRPGRLPLLAWHLAEGKVLEVGGEGALAFLGERVCFGHLLVLESYRHGLSVTTYRNTTSTERRPESPR